MLYNKKFSKYLGVSPFIVITVGNQPNPNYETCPSDRHVTKTIDPQLSVFGKTHLHSFLSDIGHPLLMNEGHKTSDQLQCAPLYLVAWFTLILRANNWNVV